MMLGLLLNPKVAQKKIKICNIYWQGCKILKIKN
jgi:hypothetical protein